MKAAYTGEMVVITITMAAPTLFVAYPILHRYGFPATIFLVSDKVGGANRWDEQAPLRNRALMSWSEIREMLHGGMTFGAHTRTHPILTDVSSDLARALPASRRVGKN
jgi:peptidoglycan/xylan/chitin deacetylase (PgdA/CDA1 family)